MSDKSGIEWTEATWNPATGCTKVSPGCKFCYAKHQVWPRLSKNPNTVYFGRKFEDVQTHAERLDQPLRWRKPRRIFVNSMSDLFHEDIPWEFIDEVFAVMALAPQHIFQVLTKRHERMHRYLSDEALTTVSGTLCAGTQERIAKAMFERAGDLAAEVQWPLPNVWIGVSVENQKTADERIPLLLETPAAVRWLSCEPLLEYIDLEPDGLDWIVVGGESGVNARPMLEHWAQGIRNRCLNRGVPFFMKQGSQSNWPEYHNFDSFPQSLQVREYPND